MQNFNQKYYENNNYNVNYKLSKEYVSIYTNINIIKFIQ